MNKAQEIANELRMKLWQREEISKAKKRKERQVNQVYSELDKTLQMFELTKRLILAFREQPSSIFGTRETLFVLTDNHLLAHDAVRELGVQFKRETLNDGFNYVGLYERVRVVIYGAKKAGRCRLVKRVKKIPSKLIPAHEEEVYESVCG